MRRLALVALLVLALVGVAIWRHFALPHSLPLTQDERRLVLARLRGREGTTPLPQRTLAGPLFAVVYAHGAPVLRLESRAPTLAAAVAALAPRLVDAPPGRLKVDVTLAVAPIVARPEVAFALALVPGVDGIGVRVEGREHFVTTDELMRADALAAWQPIPDMEFELGIKQRKVDELLARAAGTSVDAFTQLPRSYFRFRSDAFVEPAAGGSEPVPLFRGAPRSGAPRLSKEALLNGALAGGKYLLRHLFEDGRFGYEYDPANDQDERFGFDYSLPRHAGATYFLSQLYGETRDPALLGAARQALRFLSSQQPAACGRPDRGCVVGGEAHLADLGSAAMTLLALTEFERSAGDRSELPWARRLARFLVYMQKPDGDFCHVFDHAADRRDEKTRLLYFSGEATFALARFAQLVGERDPDYAGVAGAVRRGLTYLTTTQYSHLLGQFYFGEDHWTCLAADAAWDLLSESDRQHHGAFCDAFAHFLRRSQFAAEDRVARAQPDFAGAYGFSPLLPPHPTPVGSRSEAVIATYAMQLRRGLGDSPGGRATRAQIERGLQFLLDHQLRDDGAYLMANPESARGGFLMSDVIRFVRIDFIQHACSAMLRARALL